MSFLAKLTTALWISLCLTLTACGGGGGSGGSDNNTPPSNDTGNDGVSDDDSSGDDVDDGEDTGDNGSDDSSDDGSDTGSDDDGTGDDADDGTGDDGTVDDGSDGDGEDSTPEPVGPERDTAPSVNVSAGVKQLNFNWEIFGNDDHYHLWQYDDGSRGESLADFRNTDEGSIDVAVHRFDWATTSFMVEACAAHTGQEHNECFDSARVSVDDVMLDAIGYFKPSGEAASSAFGASVVLSADGHTMAAGSEDGSVNIYHRADNGWAVETALTADAADSGFGQSLALSSDGQTLLVGAPAEGNNSGAVYVYQRTDAGWPDQGTRISATNTEEGDAFGHSLAIAADGLRFVVGAPGEASASTGLNGDDADNSASGAGAAYVFSADGDNWTQSAYVKASNTAAGDAFGRSVAFSDDGLLLAVGAPGEDGQATGVDGDSASDGAEDAGAAYLFVDSDGWQQQAYVKATDTSAGHAFGSALALSGNGDTLAVGAPGTDTAGAGQAYLYQNGGSWAAQTTVTGSDTEAGHDFGASLALSQDGQYLVVGAPNQNGDAVGIDGNTGGNAVDAGAAYGFQLGDAGWSQDAYIKAPNTDAGDQFGSSLALSADGDTLAVGATGEASAAQGIGGDQADNSAEGRGAVYLY